MGFVLPERDHFPQLAAGAGAVRSPGLHHPARVDAPARDEPLPPLLVAGREGLPGLRNGRSLAACELAAFAVALLVDWPFFRSVAHNGHWDVQRSTHATSSGMNIASHSSASVRSAIEPPRRWTFPSTRTIRASPKIATTSSCRS